MQKNISSWMGDSFMRGFMRRQWASFPGVRILCTLCIPQKSIGWDRKPWSPRVHTHARRSCSRWFMEILKNKNKNKTKNSMHRRLSSATFPVESDSKLPWQKFQWENKVYKKTRAHTHTHTHTQRQQQPPPPQLQLASFTPVRSIWPLSSLSEVPRSKRVITAQVV